LHRFNRRVDPRARRSSGVDPEARGVGWISTQPSIGPRVRSSFRGVPPETTNCDSTNRDVGHPVSTTRSIQTDRSIGRPTSRAVRRTNATDERDAWRRNEVKQNSPILCVPVATRVSRRRPIDASHLASRIHDPLLASRTRASRSNLETNKKKSIPYLFVRTLDGGDRLDRGRTLRDGGVGLLRDRDRGAGDGGGHGVHLLCDVRVFVWCVEGVARAFVCL
jgi:hypothetical protein